MTTAKQPLPAVFCRTQGVHRGALQGVRSGPGWQTGEGTAQEPIVGDVCNVAHGTCNVCMYVCMYVCVTCMVFYMCMHYSMHTCIMHGVCTCYVCMYVCNVCMACTCACIYAWCLYMLCVYVCVTCAWCVHVHAFTCMVFVHVMCVCVVCVMYTCIICT